MLTIASVFKPGNGFTDDYVTRLRDNVEEFCKVEHRFVCLSTVKIDGVECIPLEKQRKGYWNKLDLFRKDLFPGPVVYFDLDTMIVDDITDICTYPHRFTIGQNWKYDRRSMASGFMAWDGREDLSYLNRDVPAEKYPRGDQQMIQAEIRRPWQTIDELFPDRLVSYKYHVRRQRKVPKGASIVAFHGKPRPHEVNWNLPC